jgi:hypothetical protein
VSESRRKQILLLALLVVLALVTWWRLGPRFFGEGHAGPRGARGIGSASGSVRAKRAALPEVVELRLEDLEAVSGDLEPGRDPFHARQPEPTPKPPPAPDQSALRAAMERARLAAEAQEQAGAEIVRAVPRPPPVDIVFLGSFGPDRKRYAVFTDGSEIFNAGEGEVLKDKYVVVRIGFESADLGFVGFPEAPAQRLEIGG